jgi:gamma-glutamyltranspeptidase/glutathione hydrolase
VATAATLGVTEPFSSGIGGGGFFVHYDAENNTVHTIDGRESGPADMTTDYFVNKSTGAPYAFQEARISGLSVGAPGSLATWATAAKNWGTQSLGSLLQPAVKVAEYGFPVDSTFQQQIADNFNQFGQFDATSALYLPNGQPPAVGSTQRNPDLARHVPADRAAGHRRLLRRPVGSEIAQTVQHHRSPRTRSAAGRRRSGPAL